MVGPWFVEIVLDTGQRYQSVDLESEARAVLVASDMRRRLRVIAVTTIHVRTGECVTKPSRNLAGVLAMGGARDYERHLLAEALGA